METRQGDVPKARAVSGLLADAQLETKRVRVRKSPRADDRWHDEEHGDLAELEGGDRWCSQRVVNAVGTGPPVVMSGIQRVRATSKI